ncbi:MAG: transcription termination/antitermination NusG family protein [Chthoniobacterales bacterium]
MSSAEQLLWYCVSTRPKQENKVARLLRKEMELEVFSPVLRFRRPRRNVPIWVSEALFPGYVFVRCVYAWHHRQIRATSGVADIIRFGDLIQPLPDSLVAEIRSLVTDQETIEIQQEPQAGQEIVIASGPYAGMRALVTRLIPAQKRVAILFEILGQMREIEIEAARLLPSNPRLIG